MEKIAAKKKFGQNFLKDNTVLEKIIQAMPKNELGLVEIGPGLGDLTEKLLGVKPLRAYEVDDELSVFLNTHFSSFLQNGRFELINEDVLSVWEKGSLSDYDYDIVANLPYYIATNIILRALKDTMCKSMTVMTQKEVALKFAALPKKKEFCSLSVLGQSIAKVRVLFDVPPSAFEPSPKVVSSVIQFEKFQEYEDIFTQDELKRFETFLRLCFAQPRKTLLKNLSSSYPKDVLLQTYEKLSLVANVRGHELDTKTFHNLFNILTKVEHGRRNTKTTNTKGQTSAS